MIDKIIDHYEQAKSRILEQMKNKPVIDTRLQVIMKQIQALEDVFYDIYLKKLLVNATGKTLELIGGTVGQERPLNTNDTIYLSLIYAKISENISNGTRPELNDLLRLLGAVEIYHKDIYPCAVNINVRGDMYLPPSEIKKSLVKASLPIELDVIQYYTEPFGFSGDSTAFGFSQGYIGTAL